MKKKVNITIDEDLHLEMKKEAIERKMLVSEVYEEMIKKFLDLDDSQKTLDEM